VGKANLWIVSALLFSCSAIAFFRTALLPTIGHDLMLGPQLLGLFTSAYGLGRVATDIGAARFADRGATIDVLAASGLMTAVSCGLLAFAGGEIQLVAAGLILGVALSIGNTRGMRYFSSEVSNTRRGLAMAGFSVATAGGQSVGPTIGGVIAQVAGWRFAFAVGAVATIAATIGARVLAAGGRRGGAANPLPSAPREMTLLAGRERAALFMVTFSLTFAMAGLIQTVLPISGSLDLGLNPAAIGVALGAGAVARIAATFGAGAWADRGSRKRVLLTGLLLSALATAFQAAAPGVTGWIAAIIMLSVGAFAVNIATTIIAARTPIGVLGRALSRFRLAGDLGLVAGPIVCASAYAGLGSKGAALAAGVLLLLTAATCANWIRNAEDPTEPPAR
jgi:MFS family permease